MNTATMEMLQTGEICAACGEEITLEPMDLGEVELGCGCSCASTLG